MGKRVDQGARWMLAGCAWLAGCAAQLQQPDLWEQASYLALAGPAALFGWLSLAHVVHGRRSAACTEDTPSRPGGFVLLARLASVALLAFSLCGMRAHAHLADRLEPALEGQELRLVGVVASLPQAHALGLRFEFDVEQVMGPPGRAAGEATAGVPRVPSRLSLGWYHGRGRQAPVDVVTPPRAGERWALTVRLKRPHGHHNPHGFDFELWMLERGLGASGYVRQEPAAARPRRLGEAWSYPVQRLRQALRDRLQRQLKEGPVREAGVVATLMLGDQAAIDDADWVVFRRTGVAHLVSISGLHVTMFAWLAAGLVGMAWRRSTRLMLAWPTPQAARWGGLLLAGAYAALAGWGVPAQRTVLMLAAVVVVQSLGRCWPWPLTLLAAAVVVSAVDPWALLQPGFWLSFGAVGLLLASARQFEVDARPSWSGRLRHGAAALLRTQAVASVGLAPLTLLFFQQISLVGFVANLLAIPLVTLAITPLALGGALWPPLWSMAASLVGWWAETLHVLAAWPWAVWTAAVAPAWAVAASLLGATLMVLRLPRALRLCGLLMLLPALWPAPPGPREGRFELLALDVGQGTAVLLRTRSHALLYDAGPGWPAGGDAGARVVVPVLQAEGVRRLDLLVLSHADLDHVGGAASVLAAVPVAALASSLPLDHALIAAARPIRHDPCADGQSWRWDGVDFAFVHPGAGPASKPGSTNALSCVLRVSDAQGRSLLLTGDIEAAQEKAMVGRHGASLASRAMMVPHHGSKTSSSAVLLDAVVPELAFVQAGYRSRFGHPAAEVVARYEQRGVTLLRSDRCGAWRWRGEGAGECSRAAEARYWHHPP